MFVPVPEAVGSSLAPGGSSLLIDGRPATGLVVAPNGSANELEARGPGFTMTVQGQSTGGRPVALGQSGALRVGTGGRVESRGTGFRSGSQVGVFVDPSTAPTRLRKTPRAAGTSVGTLTVNGLGAFDGTVTLPANLAPGSHVLQIVGQAPDGSTRAVNLGIEVVQQPGTVTISASRRDKSGQVVTISGRVTGIDASTVVPYVRSGKNPKPSAVTTRPVVAADGTFTWRLRNPSTVTVFVTAGGVRSNRLVIPAKTTTGVSTTPITKQRPAGSTN